MSNESHIPRALKALNQWVCYKLIPNQKGRTDKIPYNARTGGKARSNDPTTWCDFETAYHAKENYSGLGIMLGNGLVGIDIDHCVDEKGKISTLASNIIDTINSYSEYSPSGTGIHILAFAQIDISSEFYCKNPHNGIEIYDKGRFFTITGNQIDDYGVSHCTEAVRSIQQSYMRREDELLRKAMQAKNGEKFMALWHGNITGYNSHSEADLALCNLLCFWTSGNKEKMDSYFRQSGLYRSEKWDRTQSGSTYGTITIEKALKAYKDKIGAAFQDEESIIWEQPISFQEVNVPSFPLRYLPEPIRQYVFEVACTTQTAVDMGATASLAVLALCLQGKYKVQGKTNWKEPLNLYTAFIASPAERKSAVMNFMTQPLIQYETTINAQRDALIIENQMKKNILEKEKRSIEEAAAKGKVTTEQLANKSREIAEFKELKQLKLFVDDITSEKLSSVLADNDGKMGIISSEGGIFDILSGMYSKTVNIDVFLKAHSGDTIRVDRIGRSSESIQDPALTVLLGVQPSVLNGLMTNSTFRGRGLTARFLYSMPVSRIGKRYFDTPAIDQKSAKAYETLITRLLNIEHREPQVVQLSKEAYMELAQFADGLETKLTNELSELADWSGKLTGTILRIAGILHVVKTAYPEQSNVSQETMEEAIGIGEYYLAHAKAVYSLMGSDPIIKQCDYMIKQLRKQKDRTSFSKRDLMRLCRQFKTTDEMRQALSRLVEHGYLEPKIPIKQGAGRPPDIVYFVNPAIYKEESQEDYSYLE